MLILVTGGTGFLGRRLVLALLREGHRVRALGRNPAVCDELTLSGVEVCRGDLRHEAAVDDACADVDVVVHAGALSAPWGRRPDFHAVNVTGTANVLAACRKHRSRRLVHISSPSVVFDGSSHFDLTEAAPYARRFTSAYALSKKLAEDAVNAAAGSGLETVILRPKALFGPGDTTLLPRLLTAARQNRLPQIGDGRNLVDLTYVDNVVDAIRLALTAKTAPGRTYTITNGEHVLLWAVIRTVLRHLGIDPRLRPLPFTMAYGLAALMELHAKLFGGEPLLTRYTAAILGRTQTYDITAARRDLGFRPRVSVGEGIERTLAALTGRGDAAASPVALAG
jgi:nucleoside-diphosphate-sugar epimerase